MRTVVWRLRPGEDLRAALERRARIERLRAAVVLSAVGSLRDANLRLSGAATAVLLPGSFEIVSLAGTLSLDGAHLHVAVADRTGQVIGGHLAIGCPVLTTAEVVVAELSEWHFRRELDAQTGYRELTIRRRYGKRAAACDRARGMTSDAGPRW